MRYLRILFVTCIGTMLLIACETKPTPPKINKISSPNDSSAQNPLDKSSTEKNANNFPTTTELKVGQNLIVTLETRRGLNEIWRVQRPLPQFLTLDSETKQMTLGLGTGTATTQTFKFTANNSGKETLSFLLGTPDEPGATPREIRTTLLIVSAQ
ncbi:MAG: protease inhibitor I42 family protein [Planctomycetota bacterium]|nr:protease inhibitor I42 family protein [Planctomycetota bacterium]